MSERIYIEFDSQDQDENILRGTVIKIGDIGEQKDFFGNVAKFKVPRIDSVIFDEPMVVKLGHGTDVMASTRSRYLRFERSPKSVTMYLTYPDTDLGQSAKEGVLTGVYNGLSAEIEVLSSKLVDGVKILEKVLMDGVALVTKPAFRSSTFFDDIPKSFSHPDRLELRRDIIGGFMPWGKPGIVSASRRVAVLFEKGSLEVPESVALTLGANYDNILGSSGNGFVDITVEEDGIRWSARRFTNTDTAQNVKKLIGDNLVTNFKVGFQRRLSSMSKLDIGGVEYDLETVQKALLCEIRLGSDGMGGNGNVESPRRRRRRR